MSALALALMLPAAASASQRFASPDGTGGACTQASPCSITTAINSAATQDDVLIEPGTYGSPSTPLTTTLSDNSKFLTIHGQAGSPRPVIYSSATPWALGLSGGSAVSNLKIIDSAASAYAIFVVSTPATITRVDAETTGAGSWACYPDGEIIDSLCWASGPNGGGARPLVVNSVSVVGEDDTFVGTGTGGYGIEVIGQGPTTMAFNVTNSIIHGASEDVFVQGGVDPTGTVTFGADHSNFATVDNAGGSGTITVAQPGSGTNQTAPPLFVDQSGGDFHEASGSPTIDAGKNTNVTNVDLDGVPRPLGNGVDIGAYEWVPPPTCQPVTATTAFQTAAQIQLSCQDLAGAKISYFYSQHPAHGTVSIDPATGVATYTPAAGYSGPDSFIYDGQSSHGESAASTVSITVGKAPAGKPPAPILSHFKHKGRTFSFTLSADAKVTLTIERKGHKPHKISGKLSAGKDKIKLTRKLKRGKYTVKLSAKNAGGTSKTRQLKFKIKH